MYKICIWENIPSPHHSAFFKKLFYDNKFDVEIRYFEKFHQERVMQGWKEELELPVEKYVSSPDEIKKISDYKERIHIIPGDSTQFTKELIEICITEKLFWIHWSERGGIALAEKLHYNMKLFNILYPLYARIMKFNYAKKINKFALKALGQGVLAKKSFLQWGVKNKKIDYLFYTINDNHSLKKLSVEKNKYIFMYVGRLNKRKGTDILIKSFAEINAEKWELWLVGYDESNGKYSEMVEKLCKNDKCTIKFLGPKPIEDIPSYMNLADVFILPTRFDGWGAVLQEAASLGKALISTNQCGSAFHLIENDKNGFIVKAGSVSSLKKAMFKYVDDINLIQKHGVVSKEIYKKFTPQENVNRLYNILKDLEKNNETNF